MTGHSTSSISTADFLTILQSVPEDQRAALVQQYFTDTRERQQRLDEEESARRAAEWAATLEEVEVQKAKVARLRADKNLADLSDLRRAANERVAIKNWNHTMLIFAALIAIPGIITFSIIFRYTDDASKEGTAILLGVLSVIIGAALTFIHRIGVVDCQAKAAYEQFYSYLKIMEGDGVPEQT
ncbi:hypothetical protein HK097_008235 [Rhizophlyctis rosea]|uniref:Uncharacterized protein n=1 Tax=Rhizophlyctis rosea TaxID=64517 RepID=A0AAD5X162_9FUNG|nr:hypothetical protein HK097_008235 [Rhizophlyctis rosea]